MSDEPTRTRVRRFLRDLKRYQPHFEECKFVDVNTRGKYGTTPLMIAVGRQDIAAIADLLSLGADPNLPGEDDRLPLHRAVSSGDVAIVRLLLAHGASPDIKDVFGRTPLYLAQIRAQVREDKEILAEFSKRSAMDLSDEGITVGDS